MALINGFQHKIIEVQYRNINEYVTYYLDRGEIEDSYSQFGDYIWYVDGACTIPVSNYSTWQDLYDAGYMLEFNEEGFFGIVYYGIEQPKPKKFLDLEGVKHLSGELSLKDYPNNETLVAVINAIDETKADKEYVNEIFNTYILNIDYNTLLAFDTSEIVFGSSTSSILGQAILGQMVLA